VGVQLDHTAVVVDAPPPRLRVVHRRRTQGVLAGRRERRCRTRRLPLGRRVHGRHQSWDRSWGSAATAAGTVLPPDSDRGTTVTGTRLWCSTKRLTEPST